MGERVAAASGPLPRRKTRRVMAGGVAIGGDAPIVVQSMTNTDTADVSATVAQCAELARAGSEIVRITVNKREAAAAVPEIRERLLAMNLDVPLVGDFHFNGHKLLAEVPACAEALAKLRINPGNVGKGAKRDEQFAQIVDIACKHGKPVRIGVNWGSLDPQVRERIVAENQKRAMPRSDAEIMRAAVVTSALESAALAEKIGLPGDAIVLSCKMSGVQDLIAVYRELAARCDYPLHLGLTEAGMGSTAIVESTAALAILLQEGIGDTIRLSLTPEPGEKRTKEVVVAREILQALGLRTFLPAVKSCPGCGRTTSTTFQELSRDIKDYVLEKMPAWELARIGVENMKVAVMGCVVNGPGESKHASLGISLPGDGEEPVAPVYADGERITTLRGADIAAEFKKIIDDYVARKYPSRSAE